MRHAYALVLLVVSTRLPVAGQQAAQLGTGQTPPILIESSEKISTPRHCNELDGVVNLAATIDIAGIPRDLKTLESSDRRLEAFATEIIEVQHFNPSTRDGSPMAAAVELSVGLHTCAEREKHPTGEDFYGFTLRAHPMIAVSLVAPPAPLEVISQPPMKASAIEQVGAHISTPIPTVIVDPHVPVSRKHLKRGICLVGITIDANGLPQSIHIVRSLEPELDVYAIEAAKKWRFKPALRDQSAPVAVEGTLVANFLELDKEPVAYAIFDPEIPEKINDAISHHGPAKISIEVINGDEVSARYMPHRRIPGHYLVSLTIDPNGVPHNVHLVKGVDSGLDMDIVAMIEHSRYKVTMLDGSNLTAVGSIISIHYHDRVAWKDLISDLMPFVL